MIFTAYILQPFAAMVTCLYMNKLLSRGTKNVIIQSINHSIMQLVFQASAQTLLLELDIL